jgi:ATP-dependent DNA helicase RecQ
VKELGLAVPSATTPARRAAASAPDDPVYAALKRWRFERASTDEKPPYVVFHNTTLAAIAARRPRDLCELGTVPGVGPVKLARYGSEVLAVLGDSSA